MTKMASEAQGASGSARKRDSALVEQLAAEASAAFLVAAGRAACPTTAGPPRFTADSIAGRRSSEGQYPRRASRQGYTCVIGLDRPRLCEDA